MLMAALPVASVHEHVHQRAGEQYQPWKVGDQMCAVFNDENERTKCEKPDENPFRAFAMGPLSSGQRPLGAARLGRVVLMVSTLAVVRLHGVSTPSVSNRRG